MGAPTYRRASDTRPGEAAQLPEALREAGPGDIACDALWRPGGCPWALQEAGPGNICLQINFGFRGKMWDDGGPGEQANTLGRFDEAE